MLIKIIYYCKIIKKSTFPFFFFLKHDCDECSKAWYIFASWSSFCIGIIEVMQSWIRYRYRKYWWIYLLLHQKWNSYILFVNQYFFCNNQPLFLFHFLTLSISWKLKLDDTWIRQFNHEDLKIISLISSSKTLLDFSSLTMIWSWKKLP